MSVEPEMYHMVGRDEPVYTNQLVRKSSASHVTFRGELAVYGRDQDDYEEL